MLCSCSQEKIGEPVHWNTEDMATVDTTKTPAKGIPPITASPETSGVKDASSRFSASGTTPYVK